MISIRVAEQADLPALLQIYNEEVLHGTATFDLHPKTLAERQVVLFYSRTVCLCCKVCPEKRRCQCLDAGNFSDSTNRCPNTFCGFHYYGRKCS